MGILDVVASIDGLDREEGVEAVVGGDAAKQIARLRASGAVPEGQFHLPPQRRVEQVVGCVLTWDVRDPRLERCGGELVIMPERNQVPIFVPR
jgi:hypothetical protein